MPYIGQELSKLKMPIILITGGLDEKFTRINQNLMKSFPKAKHKLFPQQDTTHTLRNQKVYRNG